MHRLLAAEQIRQETSIISSYSHFYCAGLSKWSSGLLQLWRGGWCQSTPQAYADSTPAPGREQQLRRQPFRGHPARSMLAVRRPGHAPIPCAEPSLRELCRCLVGKVGSRAVPYTLWHIFTPSDTGFSMSAQPDLSVAVRATCLTCPVLYMTMAPETPALPLLPDVQSS